MPIPSSAVRFFSLFFSIFLSYGKGTVLFFSVRKDVVKEQYLEQTIGEASFSGSAEATEKIDYCTGPRENH